MGLLVLSQLRAGAKLQRQTLLSSGDPVYKHKDKGLLRASALTKYNNYRKNKTKEEIKHFFVKIYRCIIHKLI